MILLVERKDLGCTKEWIPMKEESPEEKRVGHSEVEVEEAAAEEALGETNEKCQQEEVDII